MAEPEGRSPTQVGGRQQGKAPQRSSRCEPEVEARRAESRGSAARRKSEGRQEGKAGERSSRLEQRDLHKETPEAARSLAFSSARSPESALPAQRAADLRGRPPNAPFARAAVRLGRLRDLPPAAPSRAAIHFREPRTPSRIPGT